MKLLTPTRHYLVVENGRAPFRSLKYLLSNLSSSLIQPRRNRVAFKAKFSRKGSSKMTMDSLGKTQLSRPVKATMPRAARMGDCLALDRDKIRDQIQELQTPQLMYKTQC